jgi:hypothetical protein
MSDFRLPEIAFLARKDARTIRRWCEAGLVRGAFRLGGERGHWRIRASSALEAAEQALAATQGFSRNRGKSWEVTLRRFATRASKVQRAARPIRLQMVKLERGGRRVSRALLPLSRVFSVLLEMSDDRLQKIGWSRPSLEALKEKVISQKTATILIQSALLLLMLEAVAESVEPDQSDIARRLGMTTRQFKQHYAAHWNTAASALDRMVGGAKTADAGYVTSPRVDEPGEIGQVVFHESGTPDDLRAWASGARQCSRLVN